MDPQVPHESRTRYIPFLNHEISKPRDTTAHPPVPDVEEQAGGILQDFYESTGTRPLDESEVGELIAATRNMVAKDMKPAKAAQDEFDDADVRRTKRLRQISLLTVFFAVKGALTTFQPGNFPKQLTIEILVDKEIENCREEMNKGKSSSWYRVPMTLSIFEKVFNETLRDEIGEILRKSFSGNVKLNEAGVTFFLQDSLNQAHSSH